MKKTGLAALFTAGAMMLTGCTSGASKKVAMEIGDVKITNGEIGVMASSITSYGYEFDQAKSTMKDQIEETFKYGAVGKAMDLQLEEGAADQVKQMTAQYAKNAGGLKAYKKYLASMGTDIDFLNELFTASAYQTLVMDKINEELKDKEPTDEEIQQFFSDNYYRAKHILIEKEAPEATEEATDDAEAATEEADEKATEAPATQEPVYGKEEADKLLERAKGGENFDEMIKKYSTDPGSESNPDGYIFTEGDMVSEFYEAVKSIEPGEFTVCESQYGYHIIQRLPLSMDEKPVKTWFDENKETIKSAIQTKMQKDKLDEYCEQYNIKVTVNQDVIDAYSEEDVKPMPTPAATDNAQ